METIIIKPKNQIARNKLNSFLEEMKDYFVCEELPKENKTREKPYDLKKTQQKCHETEEGRNVKNCKPKKYMGEYIVKTSKEAEQDLKRLKKSGRKSDMKKVGLFFQEIQVTPKKGLGHPKPLTRFGCYQDLFRRM